MSVVNAWAGAPTASGFRVIAKVDSSDTCRLVVADNPSLTAPIFFGPETPSAQNVVQLAAAGLAPDTQWWWAVEHDGTTDTDFVGTVRTAPADGTQASFTFGVSACAGSNPETPGVNTTLTSTLFSNHAVFATAAAQAETEQWAWFTHLGDLHYADFGLLTADTVSNRRQAYDDVLAQPNQQQLMMACPWTYVWSDHDYAFESQRGSYADKANAAQVYRERFPHFSLDDTAGIWQSWTWGRVLVVMWDQRYYADDNADPEPKTMLGASQLAWFENLLETSTAEALIILSGDEWLGTKSDSWASFAGERDAIVDLLAEHGWLRRTVMVTADLHAVGICSGMEQTWGRFPVLQTGSMDSSPSSNNANRAMFDVLQITAGRAQYSTVSVRDEGSHLLITLSAYRDGTLLGSYTHGVVVDVQPAATFPTDVLSGSHTPRVEARAVTGQPTTADPDGTDVPVVGGDVDLDGTARVRGNLMLITVGVDPDSGRSWFPRRPGDLLAPYGNEIWVRRGVDLGDEVHWVPLGFFRIRDVEQGEAPDHELRIMAEDRMAGIVEAELLQPRVFDEDRTVGSVVFELVREVYSDAVVIFDDDTVGEEIGRQLVVERSRYEALLDLARAFGKIIYWDGVGAFRFETAPDETSIVWEVKAGKDGVLLRPSQAVTRAGVHNALVAEGEGQDDKGAVREVVVDRGPNSPTRFGGPFGKVPRFYSSPLLTTAARAEAAARELLRRELGAVYSAEFVAVVNPALAPYDAVRVTFRDGTRERHVMERVRIPLTAGAAMHGVTREKTTVVIGAQL